MDTMLATIQGKQFTIPKRYAAGHTLGENEAAALNQLLVENVRNNFAQKIKAAQDAKEPEPGQTELDAYVAGYTFGVRSVGVRTTDPVLREAQNLAEAAIKKALLEKGVVLKTVSDEKMDALIAAAIEKQPSFMEQAKVIVGARQSAVGNLGLDLASASAA